jgi:hypothetical protein
VENLVLKPIVQSLVDSVALMIQQENLKLIMATWLLALGSMVRIQTRELLSIVCLVKPRRGTCVQRLAVQMHVLKGVFLVKNLHSNLSMLYVQL